jgi:hypothetical protein
MPRRTTTVGFALAALVLAATTACTAAPLSPSAPTTSSPSPSTSQPTAQQRWVVTGTGHAGPKIGSPGPEQTTYIVYCTTAESYRPDADTDDPDAPIREREVDPTVAETAVPGEPCPPGRER